MFSGLTSQVSNWMGKKAEDGGIAEQPTDPVPTTDAENPDPSAGSPTKGSSKLEMLAGVKSQVASSMSGWLSGGIPGLNRGNAASAEGDAATQQQPTTDTTIDPSRDPTTASATENVKDDDASRWVAGATGGADSGPGSLGGTPTEEKDGQQPFGAGGSKITVSTKALAGAKSLGGFLYSAVNKAGKSVAEAGAKVKKVVEENIQLEEEVKHRLIAELNKEQEAFIASKPGEQGEAVAPWVGAPNEDTLREECLALSTDRRNFVRAPPPGVDFAWDFEAVQPMAQATLALDSNLEQMRFELVPKVISEENFWRNYFYRVSLLRQSHELNAMANQSTDGADQTQLATSDSVEHTQAVTTGPTNTSGNKQREIDVTPANNEFVSDSMRASDSDIKEVKEGMKKLGIEPTKEEDWERELEAELKDYEVVPTGQKSTTAKDDWDDGQIDELLKDEQDLK